MQHSVFQPFHLNATPHDLAGNNGIGRYILLADSAQYAQKIANQFEYVTVKHHPRDHTLYLGTLTQDKIKIDVATVQSGMGCASMEIILHELFHLGAKRFLRVGTANSLQPKRLIPGELVNVQATVRDEGTTHHYAPAEFPAIASLEFITSILVAAEKLNLIDMLHTGIVHCKSSFYAREIGAGSRSLENQAYLTHLKQLGVLATEMETAALFIQSQLYDYQFLQQGNYPQNRVLAGAILAVTNNASEPLEETHLAAKAIEDSIELAIETIKVLASQEL